MTDQHQDGFDANKDTLLANTNQNIDLETEQDIEEISESQTAGDPVLLSSGAYTSTVYDLQWTYHGLPLPLTRVYNENGRGTALGENWHLSLESHVVFGIDAQIRELAKQYNDYVSDSETKLDEWRATIKKWLDEINKKPRGHVLGYDTKKLRNRMNALQAKADAFELVLISFKVQRDEYNRRLKIAEAHIQRNQYRGGYDSDAFVGNDYVLLVDETGTGILYKIASPPDYNATTPYIDTSIVNHYPQGRTFTADDPDADHLTMRSDGVLVREKADLSRWYYDIYGRVFRIENQFRKGYDLEYAPNSAQLVKITDDANRQITLVWSGGRLISVSDYAGRQVTYAYSGNHLIGVTDPDGDSSRYEYTSAGRMKKTIKPDNTFIELHYHIVDGKEVVVGTTDEEKARETFSYKVSNNEIVETTYTTPSGVKEVHQINDHLVTRTTYADGSSHQRTYNTNRQLTNETLRSGEELRYDYDTFGRIVLITYGDGSTEEMSYQNKGRQITRYLDRRGNVTTYDYNSTNQLTSIRYPVTHGSSTEVFSYTSEAFYPHGKLQTTAGTTNTTITGSR